MTLRFFLYVILQTVLNSKFLCMRSIKLIIILNLYKLQTTIKNQILALKL